MSSRDIQLDVLKGLGIILVVFAHTAHNSASDFVYLFHMPLFFFLSGAALSFSWDADYHLGKRLYRIMVPYVAFSLLSFFYWRLVESRFRPVHDGDLFPMLSGMLDMGWQQFLNIFLAFSFEDAFLYNVVLWFLPCLLMSTMIYTCVRRNLGRYEIVGVVLVAILGLAITELRLPFCSEIAFAAVPFLWCGRLLYKRLCASAALVGGDRNFSSCYGGNGDVQSPCGYADTCLWLLVAILSCSIRTNHSSCHIQQMACWEGIWYPSMAWAQQSGCHVRT